MQSDTTNTLHLETPFGENTVNRLTSKWQQQFYESTYNVLILEDDQELNQRITDYLLDRTYDTAKPHFIVYNAYTYEEGVAIAKMVKIDIFILDIYLSKHDKSLVRKSGLSYAKLLKNNHQKIGFYTPKLRHDYQFGSPIIFLTSEHDPEKQVKVHDEARPNIYLKKPQTMAEVQEAVNHVAYAVGLKPEILQLKNVANDTLSEFYHHSIVWATFEQHSPSKPEINYVSYETGKKTKNLNKKQCSVHKMKLALTTGFIDGLPVFLINPSYITGYDERNNALILTYPDGFETITFKPNDKQKKTREVQTMKEKRIPIPEKHQEIFKIIADRMRRL